MSLKAIVTMSLALVWTTTAAALDLQTPSDLIAAVPKIVDGDSTTVLSPNVVGIAGTVPIAMVVPASVGFPFAKAPFEGMSCYDIKAGKKTDCNPLVFNEVGVAANYTCTFRGADREHPWKNHQYGTEHSGWMIVSPEQKLAEVECIEGNYVFAFGDDP